MYGSVSHGGVLLKEKQENFYWRKRAKERGGVHHNLSGM
ncbi:hypothetical protein APHCRT_1642 [Anaplasma phagocytophilum str. CRT53-1]|uniref:Uncharacterized protein n=1 Tax=Anaplasma phagocytophilum str. CRT53-1 TaxID=1359157 RepID=A0A0F3PIS8_ANAPH|nr:hypothetical protein APHCRT_1642 [Anaplasma phagocytophilum str. CRT53-1]